MKKEKLFFDELGAKGSNYSTKLKFYQSLKTQSVEDIEIWISQHLRMTQILNLLARYIKQEVEDDEKGINKIKITNEQFEQYFHIIKTREKED